MPTFQTVRFAWLFVLLGVALVACRDTPSARTNPTPIPLTPNDAGMVVVQMVDPTVPRTPLSLRVQEELGATVVEGWDGMVTVGVTFAIDAFVIDESVSMEALDLQWTRTAYREGVRMIVINKTGDELESIVEAPGAVGDGFQFDPYYRPGSYFVGVYRNDRVRDVRDAMIIEESVTTGHEPIAPIAGQRGASSESLEIDFGFVVLRSAAGFRRDTLSP